MNSKFKRNIKIIGALLSIILIVLIFFSKTIYNLNLPTVTATLPQNGFLNKVETTKAIVSWGNIEEMYLKLGGKVDTIFVKEGEKVKKGQELMRLSYDSDE